MEGDVVKQIVEKPKTFISNWASIGCYKFTPEIFQECEKVSLSERGEYELTDAIASLAEQGKVRARRMVDYWLDFGKPEDVEIVADLIRRGKLW
jgi:glucose-1-phosphate thymidylyltransferase